MRIHRFLDRFFHLHGRGTTAGREMIAGMTTFAAMSYIIVVNPMILSSTGMDKQSLLLATVVSAAVGTLIMALWANLPIALAPGMGTNIVFAQILVGQMGVSWQTGLTMVFLNALIFLGLSLTRWRERIIAAFPEPIKLGMQCSIGAFVAYLGLKSAGLVVAVPGSVAGLGNLGDHAALLALGGIVATPLLVRWRVPGALLISIVAITIAGSFIHGADGKVLTLWPEHMAAVPTIKTDLIGAFDFHQFLSKFHLLLPVTLYFLLSEFFAGTATLFGVTRRANLLTASGNLPDARAAFASDALASVVGAAVGTSTVTAYVESVAGVESGGRTGLVGVTVAVLFALSLFLAPLITIVPVQATAPALVLVGFLMMEGLREIDLLRLDASIPPLLMTLVTVLTTDLMVGMAFGCFAYTLLVAALRRQQKVTLAMLALDAVFVLYLVLRNSIN
ncbi:Xanthine/uracil/thiamine/ascorbate permease family protein [Collimonas fungivorans Ter331]|uniref:Xanthine/uracil/thiamine/ascorbate permease family protein n=2 Tax=Collimonas fungivorans TaxID=158899 RepID=G0AFQ4_COLFT|nr:Xanthine/uracil/thiamine/ascorbate permease family protein [Collimonas fungivorans Ter331]